MIWRTAAMGALAPLLAANLAMAQPTEGPPANPPPPASLELHDIERWIGDYIRPGDDVEAASTERMVLFYSPATVIRTAEGVESVVHGEQFVPQPFSAGTIRSFRDVWRFDCAKRRFMMVQSELFPQSNLQGASVQMDTSNERWSRTFDEDEGPGPLISQVCRQAGMSTGEAGLGPGVV